MSVIDSKHKEKVLSGWHLKKEVTIGQLFTLITILVTGVWWASTIEAKVHELEVYDKNLRNIMKMENKRIEDKTDILLKGMGDRFDRYQADVKDSLNKIERGIENLGEKIDRKADK